jgi:cytochrome c2
MSLRAVFALGQTVAGSDNSTLRLRVFAALLVFALCGCFGEVTGVPQERNVPGGDRNRGTQAITAYGCGSCHTINGIPGADSKAGPPLNEFYERRYIAGSLPNTPDNLVAWIEDPQAIEPGTAMPDLDVSEEDARNIAAYLYDPPFTANLLWNP